MVLREFVRRIASRPKPPRSGATVEDAFVASPDGAHSIPVRIYRPDAPVHGRGVVYLHGGAFAMGDLDLMDESCYAWSRDAGCVVVSVDYRLAPEHPFPAALDDGYAALRWAADHAVELSIDPQRLGIAGSSAGGALAAGIALLCRDRGGPALALQMLLYPVLDVFMSSASMQALTEAEHRGALRMWENYLGRAPREVPVHASPASCEDLAGLPPAYVAAAELDPLRDEAVTYAQRLLTAGVSAELHLWPRVPHDFGVMAPDASLARRSVREQADAIARFLG
jgi:acetyl esterase